MAGSFDSLVNLIAFVIRLINICSSRDESSMTVETLSSRYVSLMCKFSCIPWFLWASAENMEIACSTMKTGSTGTGVITSKFESSLDIVKILQQLVYKLW